MVGRMGAADSQPIAVGALEIRFLVEPEHANGTVSMFEVDVPAAARVPAPHSHDAFEETIYGLRGTTIWSVDGDRRAIGPGDALLIPRGAVHGFVNDADEDATLLAIATPGVFGRPYFEEIGAVLGNGGPPDPQAIGAVMRRHGLTPASAH